MRKIFFLILIFFNFLFVVKASAVSITPSKILLTIDPSAEQSFSLKIRNEEKQDLNYKIKILGAKQDSLGSPIFKEKIDVAETWIKPEKNNILIRSGETETVSVNVKAPKNINAGSHYLGLAVEPVFSGSGQTAISGQVVALLTLQVSGIVNESVKITRWEIKEDLINIRDWRFNLGLENDGTIEVDLIGNLIIRNWRGNEMYQKKIELGNKLLAQSVRSLEPKASLSKGNLYLPGLYQAQIKINYGKTSQIVSSLTHVWYLPNWLWGVGAGIVAILVVLIFSYVSIKAKLK